MTNLTKVSEEISTAGDLDLAFLRDCEAMKINVTTQTTSSLTMGDALHGTALDLKAANDEADKVEMTRYHAETMRLIAKYGMDAVAKIIVQCRNQALREGML